MAKERVYYDFKTVKEWLRTKAPLKLHDSFKLTDKNPHDFVKNFLLHYNSKYRTVYANNGKAQVHLDAARSVYDIYRITYFYFPKVKLITIYRVIFELFAENKLSSWICSTVCKRVYQTSPYGSIRGVLTDELGIDFQKIDMFQHRYWNGSDDTEFLTNFKIS